MKKEISVSKYLVNEIAKLGVDFIPLVQGGAIMKVIDEIGQHPTLKYFPANHEQAAAMMVDAYARLTGFGVGMATSGPGGINLATGIACAYYDSIPCLFVTGQVGRFHINKNPKVRQRGFQETDIVSIVKPITKYSVVLWQPEDVRYEFEKAVYLAKSGRPGPVLIDIPYDVQRAMINPEKLRHFHPPKQSKVGWKNDCSNILQKIMRAKRPLFLIGGGVRISNMAKVVFELSKKLNVPIVSTWGAADIIPHSHEEYLGNTGKAGNSSAVKAIQKCDLLLALGTRFTTKIIINEKEFAENAEVIAVNSDSGEVSDGLIRPTKMIKAPLEKFLPELLSAANDKKARFEDKEWLSEIKKLRSSMEIDVTRPESKGRFVTPYLFSRTISKHLGNSDLLVVDCGFNLTWMIQAYQGKGGDQRFISAWGCSPMGYALPASVGAHKGRPNVKTVCVIGDGGMQMNIQELQTIANNKIPLKIFVLNNHCYATIKSPTTKEFQGRTFATTPETGYTPPNFIKIAKAFGIKTAELKNDRDLDAKIKKILNEKGPILVEVAVDPDQEIFENSPSLKNINNDHK